jgi:hypothetical protein
MLKSYRSSLIHYSFGASASLHDNYMNRTAAQPEGVRHRHPSLQDMHIDLRRRHESGTHLSLELPVCSRQHARTAGNSIIFVAATATMCLTGAFARCIVTTYHGHSSYGRRLIARHLPRPASCCPPFGTQILDATHFQRTEPGINTNHTPEDSIASATARIPTPSDVDMLLLRMLLHSLMLRRGFVSGLFSIGKHLLPTSSETSAARLLLLFIFQHLTDHSGTHRNTSTNLLAKSRRSLCNTTKMVRAVVSPISFSLRRTLRPKQQKISTECLLISDP